MKEGTACIYCGRATIEVRRERKRGSKLALITHQCEMCGRHHVRVKLCK